MFAPYDREYTSNGQSIIETTSSIEIYMPDKNAIVPYSTPWIPTSGVEQGFVGQVVGSIERMGSLTLYVSIGDYMVFTLHNAYEIKGITVEWPCVGDTIAVFSHLSGEITAQPYSEENDDENP